MLSIQAFNALLKTLEEPPEHVILYSPHGIAENTRDGAFEMSEI